MGWWDVFSDISDAGRGIAKGLDEGMAPLRTWEGIRTEDLKNDRYEIGNQNEDYLQRARMGEYGIPEYYANQAQLANTGFQKGIGQNQYDIFGNDLRMQMGRAFTDPTGLFQERVRREGLQPGTPEFNRAVVALKQQYDPTGMEADKAYDTLGIAAEDKRAINDQTTIAMVQQALRERMGDLEIQVFRGQDGQLYMRKGAQVYDPEHPDSGPAIMKINDPDALLRASTLFAGGTPQEAINKEVTHLGAVELNNANAFQRYMTGQATPQAATSALTQHRLTLADQIRGLEGQEERIRKDTTLDGPQQEAKLAPILKQIEEKRKEQDSLLRQIQFIEQNPNFGRGGRGGAPGAGAGTPDTGTPAATNGPATPGTARALITGESSVTAPRMMPGTQAVEIDPYEDRFGQGGWAGDVLPPGYMEPQAALPPPVVPRSVVAPTAGVPQGGNAYSRSSGFPTPMDDTGGPIYDYKPNYDPNGGPIQSPWQQRTSSISRMSPQQLAMYIQRLAPNIQSQNRGPGGGGINMQQLMALLQQRGMVG
jgi:hypothetical protein